MARTITICRGASGVNNKIDPARISIDLKSGIVELAEGVNIDIDDRNRIDRCKGFTATSITSASHSMFDCGGYVLFVTGDALTVLEASGSGYTTTPIRDVTEGARMRYAKYASKIYHCNGHEIGYVEDKTAYPWTNPAYLGQTTTRTFDDPPLGHNLEIHKHKARMCIAVDEEDTHGIYLSEISKLSRLIPPPTAGKVKV